MVNGYLLDAGVIVAVIGLLGVAVGGKVEFPTVLQQNISHVHQLFLPCKCAKAESSENKTHEKITLDQKN